MGRDPKGEKDQSAGALLQYTSGLARVLALKGLRIPRGGQGHGFPGGDKQRFRDSKADHRRKLQWPAGKVPELEAGKTEWLQIWALQAMLRVSLF